MLPLRRGAIVLGCVGLTGLGLGACREEPSGPPPHAARLEGEVRGPEAVRGDAYLFLFAPGEGPPDSPGAPRYATAVPELRRARGDSRYRFAEVAPGTYRLWGFLDSNGDVDLTVDVLAQPGAGDWVPEAVGVSALAAGETATQDVTMGQRRRHSAPAFRVVGAGEDGGVVSVPDTPSLLSITVEADGLGLVRGEEARFFVQLRDGNGDGTADDVDGNGLADLFPQFFLQFEPRPGQAPPTDGGTARVVVPLVPNPAPFLGVLQGDVTREFAVERLQLFVVPQARAVTGGPDGGLVTAPLPAIPLGDYALWAVTAEGAFWRVPNALGARQAEALRSQGVRFRIVRGGAPDAGGPG